MHHVTVYREPGRFAGWPANYGIWSWGDEIAVGFTLGWYRAGEGFHARDRSRPMVTMQARSIDGGESWAVSPHPARPPGGVGLAVDEHLDPALQAAPALAAAAWGDPVPVDLRQPGFALMCSRTGLAAGAISWLYTSADRCHTWSPPRPLPSFGQSGIAARTDYLVLGPAECLLFLTAAKTDGREGRVFCARSTDGLATVDLLSWIGPEPAGFAIMPASVLLPSGRILVAVRCRGTGEGAANWIDLYASDDRGTSWSLAGRPVERTGRGGNPPTLTLLRDGRLALAYGYRDAPAGIRCRVSSDHGTSWGAERVLRADAGDHDIGYPRTVQRDDGRLVTVYYYNDAADGERYIAATIWEP